MGGREGRVAEGPTAWILEMDLSTAGKLIQPLQLAFSGLGELLPMSCVPAQTQSRAHKREKLSVWLDGMPARASIHTAHTTKLHVHTPAYSVYCTTLPGPSVLSTHIFHDTA